MSRPHSPGVELLEPCECYAIQVDGWYFALMKFARWEMKIRGQIKLSNLFVTMHYMEKELPKPAVFESRAWLHMHFYAGEGRRHEAWVEQNLDFERERLIRVGDVPSRSDDPSSSPVQGDWLGRLGVLEVLAGFGRIPTAETYVPLEK